MKTRLDLVAEALMSVLTGEPIDPESEDLLNALGRQGRCDGSSRPATRKPHDFVPPTVERRQADESVSPDSINWPYALPAEDMSAASSRVVTQTMRVELFNRDHGKCHVCCRNIAWDEYEAGHIIDKAIGGISHLSNLVVMCVYCNRAKPLTATREAYNEWRLDFRRHAKAVVAVAMAEWDQLSEADRYARPVEH